MAYAWQQLGTCRNKWIMCHRWLFVSQDVKSKIPMDPVWWMRHPKRIGLGCRADLLRSRHEHVMTQECFPASLDLYAGISVTDGFLAQKQYHGAYHFLARLLLFHFSTEQAAIKCCRWFRTPLRQCCVISLENTFNHDNRSRNQNRPMDLSQNDSATQNLHVGVCSNC